MTQSGQRVVYVGDGLTPLRDFEERFDVVHLRDRTAVVDCVETTDVRCVVVDGTGPDPLEMVAAASDAAPAVPVIYAASAPDGTVAAAATRAGATEYFVNTANESLADRVAAVSADGAVSHSEDLTADEPPRDGPGERLDSAVKNGSSEVTRGNRHRADVITELLETTRALFACESHGAVASVVVDAAERVLEFDAASVRLYDPDTEELVLAAASDADDRFDEHKRVSVHENAMGEAFRKSEPSVIEDRQSDVSSDNGPLRGTVGIPIADHGILNVASSGNGGFDGGHVQFAQLLTESAAAALERADSRADLIRHEKLLETVEGMMYATDGDARLTLVTEPLAERLGYDREALVGEHVSTIFDGDWDERAVENVRGLLTDPQQDSGAFEATVTDADGERFPVEIECSLLPRDAEEIENEEFHGTVSVVRDITRRREREQYVQVLNRVLRHNLRNDLTVVIGYAELLCEQLEDQDLAAAASTLRQTATDLAHTSEKTRAIQYALERDGELEPVDVAGIVDDAVAEEDVDDATVSVTTDDTCWAWADPGLRLIVDNLLENAVTHATPNPSVEITVTADDDRVRLTFADDGPGIPPAEIDVVTGESDITQLTHSSGLGLWLVRWMVDSYNGSVSFTQSTSGGSRVVVSLEAAPPEPSDASSVDGSEDTESTSRY
ncbi:ATP-binding protein [Natrinema halophilum]|uniref:histidine kinase n=1 Tax=Natrinema halophilum TaxID=1699371 RepID=A0A7D5H2U6_9EURY|nr:ATP-binding protein [Natrinema halophilum]QLG49291.1 ATP-binding protein [Natrinema halophilum]